MKWYRPFLLGAYKAPPITQAFGNVYEYEPLGWWVDRDHISPVLLAGCPVGRYHRGVDYGLPVGYRVRSPYGGRVVRAGYDSTGFGLSIVIECGRHRHTLGHLSGLRCRAGEKVVSGQVVGFSGGAADNPDSGNSTGPHLHWEVFDVVSGLFVHPAWALVRRPLEGA